MATQSSTAEKLAKLGLHKLADCVLHLPLRYEDETYISPITSLVPGQSGQVIAEVVSTEIILRPRRYLQSIVKDETGELTLRFINFYPSQQHQLAVGKRFRIRGEVRHSLMGLEMVHPKVSAIIDTLPTHYTPVYPSTEGLTQTNLRKTIAQVLQITSLSDSLPDTLVAKYQLMSFEQAITELHNPKADVDLTSLNERSHPAWTRIKFDELIAQQLSLAQARTERLQQRAPAMHAPAHPLLERFMQQVNFNLTSAQERVVNEIHHDLSLSHPMQRLLQGDVGSGKTVVAALAALKAIVSGYQVAVMAPTEILAEQHYRKFDSWFTPLGIQVAWLSGSLSASKKRQATEAIASGHATIAVGTQALIQEKVSFQSLGLSIIDEQHRFGVGQRLALRSKGIDETTTPLLPHQLMMTATPIPRTLAMTFYSDLEVSIIDELPPGRSPIITKLIAEHRRDDVIAGVYGTVQQGQQVYWVCPLIEESEQLDLLNATETYQTLCATLPDLRIGLVHGRLSTADKAFVMDAFIAGEIDVLVATTVVEVGVDVPNASLMIIEHAERFGLSQLHQLRGRVGRGANQSVCVLMYQAPLSKLAKQRLRTMHETTDGFVIAERDLELRGPGELLGAKQSGMATMRYADLETDIFLAEQAHQAALDLVQHHPDHVTRHLTRWHTMKTDFLGS